MTRTTVTRILVVYLLVLWAAMLVRCDRFPLTWAPMYTTYIPSESISVVVMDEERMTQGLFVTRRDGTTASLTANDLNISKFHFWRLYYQRMFGGGPAKHAQGNMNLGSFNRWIRGLKPGEPNFSAEWDWRILRALNRTLGHEPPDLKFIVRVETDYEIMRYLKADLLQKDLSKAERQPLHASIAWKQEWAKRWDDDTP